MNKIEWQNWQTEERVARINAIDHAKYQLRLAEDQESFVKCVLDRLGDFAPELIVGPVVYHNYRFQIPIRYSELTGWVYSTGRDSAPVIELGFREKRLYENTKLDDLARWIAIID